LFGSNKFNRPGVNWPIIVAIIIGLSVAAFAATRLLNYTNTHIAMENVLVMSHDVGPYTILQASDVVTQQEVKGSKQPNTINSPSDAVGKMTASALYQGDQVETKRLIDPAQVQNKQLVVVNIDLARCGAGYLRPGDIADAWWISGDAQTPGVGWVQVATNAIVVDIKDSTGKSLFGGGSTVQQTLMSGGSSAAGPPAVAVLAVNISDVSRVIGGAVPKSASIVLTKKFTLSQ
jgi:hypothetical protein